MRSVGLFTGPSMSIGSSATKSRPSGAKQRTDGNLISGYFATTSIFQSGGPLGGFSWKQARRTDNAAMKLMASTPVNEYDVLILRLAGPGEGSGPQRSEGGGARHESR